MGHRITVDEAHGIVEIRLFDAVPHQDHVRARQELIAVCRAQRIRNTLVDARDLRADSESSFIDAFDFACSWHDEMRDARLAVAVVLPRDPEARKLLVFADTVAANRGHLTRTFDDLDEAREWLRHPER